MTVLETLRAAELRLKVIPEPRLDAEYMLAEALHTSRLMMLIDKSRALTATEEETFERMVARREQREPLQYILGSQSFMGFSFKTDPRALIPRNDTEALCEEALRHIRPGDRVLDLCTGTGALGIAIKKLCPKAIVTATDISEAALSLAEENTRNLQADVRFLQGDLFAPVSGEEFEVIVSNPPYIPEALRGHLQAEVEKEPAFALFAGEDGLDFYRRIAREAPSWLSPQGWLCLEVGDGEAEAVAALLKTDFESVRILPDLNGLDRVVSGQIRSYMI